MSHLFGPDFDARLRDTPDRIAFELGDFSLSYGTLDRDARDLAQRLRACLPDAPFGTPVGLQSSCPASHLLAFLAAQYAGFAHLPMNPRLTEPERARLLRTTGAALLLSEAPCALPEGVAFALLRPAIPHPPVLGPTVDLPAPEGPPAALPRIPADAIGLIISSSGSSGQPKCVRIRRDRYAYHIAAQRHATEVCGDDIFQLLLPLFHGGGLIAVLGTSMAAGARVAAMPAGPFVAERVFEHLDRSGATLTHWIPTMLFRVAEALDRSARRFPGLRRIHFGSMPMDPGLLDRCRQFFPGRLMQTYASTECGLIGTLGPDRIDAGFDASARIYPGQGVHIVDAEGRDVAEGETGELVVERRIALIHDYAQDPDLTARVVQGDLVHSGDLVRRLPGDYFRFVARMDTMIITGGLKVTPSEVEAALASHPQIREVAVLGVPDPEFGEAVCAVIVSDDAPELEALRDWARQRLAAYKLPRRIAVLDQLPRTETGKLAFGTLRAHLSGLPDRVKG
ncbi:MAG: acyl--CoA ligase [Rhodobacter sp.]|nr:acyl--CoA ligase [Paracoccaceae bacterium]MCC0075460.1 acyl--CoA ligase [Rhodobacter sp.]